MLDGTERGVAPVVGIILLVAVVVIVVTVVGTSILERVNDESDEKPIFETDIDVTERWVNITHRGGDSVPLADLSVIVRNDTGWVTYTPTVANLSDTSNDRFEPAETWSHTHPIDAGTDGYIEVVLVHEPSDTVITKHRVSAAALDRREPVDWATLAHA